MEVPIWSGRRQMADAIPYEKFFPLAPLAGASIALFFDVGYFYGIGIDYFTLFSLAEHIGFALEALPAALAISIILIFFAVITEQPFLWWHNRVKAVSEDISRPVSERVSFLKRQVIQARIGSFLVLLVSASYLPFLWYQERFRLFLLNSVVFAMIVVKMLANDRWRGMDPILFLIIGCATALLLGEHLGSRYVASTTGRDTIAFKSGDAISANIIRSGERGVLYARPQPNVVEFAQWDTIKSISRNREKSFFDWAKT
jgi:hypothetical protein